MAATLPLEIGQLTSVSRRFAQLYCSTLGTIAAKLPSKHEEACIGDAVRFERDSRHDQVIVTELLPRKNLISRCNGHQTKLLCANVDLLLIVCAPSPLYNPVTIDRLLSIAHSEQVRCCLVFNKCDLAQASCEQVEIFETYTRAAIPCLAVSALHALGLDSLVQVLAEPQLTHVVLTGVSGVGKSTLLGKLLPDLAVRTQEVSRQTGQGRQTTSQAQGYLYRGARASPLLLTDLPGVQNIGVCHLHAFAVRTSFFEFGQFAKDCRFANCLHRQEPDCGVVKALALGLIARSRYKSYLEMLLEIDSYHPY